MPSLNFDPLQRVLDGPFLRASPEIFADAAALARSEARHRKKHTGGRAPQEHAGRTTPKGTHKKKAPRRHAADGGLFLLRWSYSFFTQFLHERRCIVRNDGGAFDVSPYHCCAPVTGLVHDRPLARSGIDRRRDKPPPQGVTG